MRHQCRNCYWNDQCYQLKPCSDYTPLEEISDEEIEERIANERNDYAKEYIRYIAQYADDESMYSEVID